MDKELLQIITPITSTIYTTTTFTQAEQELRSLQAILRLDFHGVANLLPADLKLPTKSACIISYVSTKSPHRETVKEEIQQRILSGQIQFGIIVFVRGSGKNRDSFTKPGSKAWVNSLLQVPYRTKGVFIDDYADHIRSTKLLCPHIESIQFASGRNHLINLIKSYTETASADLNDFGSDSSESSSETDYDAFNQFANGDPYKIIDWILDGKVGKDDRDDDHGESLLHWALRHGEDSLAIFLIKQGCDVNLVTHSDGQTALDMCKKGDTIYKLLIENGAKTSDEVWEENSDNSEREK